MGAEATQKSFQSLFFWDIRLTKNGRFFLFVIQPAAERTTRNFSLKISLWQLNVMTNWMRTWISFCRRSDTKYNFDSQFSGRLKSLLHYFANLFLLQMATGSICICGSIYARAFVNIEFQMLIIWRKKKPSNQIFNENNDSIEYTWCTIDHDIHTSHVQTRTYRV